MKLQTDKIGIPVLALTVFVVTMIILSVFFFITIYKNEKILEQRGFRVLTQLGSAMQEKDELISKIFTFSGFVNQSQNPLFNNFRYADNETKSLIDTLLYRSVIREPKKEISERKNNNELIIQGRVKIIQKETKTSNINIKASIKDFITSLLRTDFFSNYILIRNDGIAYSSFPGGLTFLHNEFDKKETGSVLSVPFRLTGITARDTTGKSFIQGGFVENINIQGTDYEMFIIPLKFHNESYYLGGFVEEKTFLSWKRSLPSNVIVIFIIIILIIIFSLPVLKIFISGPLEKVTRFGVSLVGISMVGGTILSVVLFTELVLDHKISKDNYQNLKRLNQEITNNFINERDTILQEMVRFDTIWKTDTDIVRNNPNYLKSKPDASSFPAPNYMNFKSLFWADDIGNQILLITPYKKGFLSNVNSRNYFLFPEKYKINFTNKPEPLWYGMEPVFSNTSGEWGIAFSMLSQKKPPVKIIAISAPLTSIKDPILPYGYEYCLIDKTGKVWYHSTEYYNLNDNLLIECNDQRFSADLQSNSTDNLQVEMRNQKYQMYLSPIANTDLFLVSFFNTSRVKAMTSFSASFAICFLGSLLFILFLIGTALGLIYHNKWNKWGSDYIFKWFAPKKSKIKRYKKLIWMNISVIVLLILVELFHKNNGAELYSFLFFLFILLGSVCIITSAVLIAPVGQSGDTLKAPGYLRSYNLFIISWLAIITVIPSVLIMKRVYLEETKWYLDDQHYYLAKELNDRTNLFFKFFQDNLLEKNQTNLFKVRNNKGIYFPFVIEDSFCPFIDVKSMNDRPSYLPRISTIRNYYYQLMQEPGVFSTDPLLAGKDSLQSDSVLLSFDKISFDKISQDQKFKKSSAKTTLITRKTGLETFARNSEDFCLLIFYFGFIFLFIFFIYHQLKVIVKKLYCYDELEPSRTDILMCLKTLEHSESNAVIISMNEFIETEVTKAGWNFMDLSGDEKTLTMPSEGKVILYNFSKGVTSLPEFTERISKLENGFKSRHVALLINKSPSIIIRELQEIWKSSSDQLQVANLINRIEKLFSGLPVLYGSQPFTENNDPYFCSYINAIIEGELRFNASFIKYKGLLNNDFDTCTDNSDNHFSKQKNHPEYCHQANNVILHIRVLSESYYHKIWNDLTMEEQFVLDDIADDTLINLKNKEIIQGLLNKGILTLKEDINFTSKAFENFILSTVDKDDVKEFEIKIGKAGNWNRLKIPLILIATSILVFLFATQQNILSNMNTIVVSVLTVMSVYLKFSGMFSKAK